MYKDYDVYKMAIKVLDNILGSIVNCQKDIIAFHQSHIDSIKENNILSEDVRRQQIDKYLSSIDSIHQLLKENNAIINLINDKSDELRKNVEQIIIDEIKLNDDNFEGIVNTLQAVINSESDKVFAIAKNARQVLDDHDNHSFKQIVQDELEKICKLKDRISAMIEGITFGDDPKDIHVINKLKDVISFEKKRIDKISSEAYQMMVSQDYDINLKDLCNKLKNEHTNILDKLEELKHLDIDGENLNHGYRVPLKLIEGIMEEEIQCIGNTLSHLNGLTEDNNGSLNNRQKLTTVIDEEMAKIQDYTGKLKTALQDLKSGEKSIKDIINEITQDSFQSEVASENLERSISQVSHEEKENDFAIYKNSCSRLNQSFWEARQKVVDEKIKYPSALFEQKVREYQNDYLIQKYNVSLEQLEDQLDSYKIKYAEDLYVDDIYDRALYDLKNEMTLSVQDLCDESTGLSLIDTRVYQYLEKDLADIIKEIGLAKVKENVSESLAVNEYSKLYSINKLIKRKEMIERQMNIIRKRADKLSKEN